MTDFTDVEKLLSVRAADPVVLSMYLPVPVDPAQLRGLRARVGDLYERALAGHGGPGRRHDRVADLETVVRLVDTHGRDWMGHSVALFVCGEPRLAETVKLHSPQPERAVYAVRPHVRPLLVALQRSPAYLAAVVDRENAWIFGVSGDDIAVVAETTGEVVPSADFGGWWGLKAYNVQQRVIQLAQHHYRDTIGILERAVRAVPRRPLVLGGHEDGVTHFLELLPATLRDRFAGAFVVDPHTMTPARVRELAGPVVDDWVRRGEELLVAGIAAAPPGQPVVTGPPEVLRAVNQRAVDVLVVPDHGILPGFSCQRCGALARADSDCPDWSVAARPVPDLLEEMVVKTLDTGGQVEAVAEPPQGVAARLRFPLAPI